MSKILIIEDDLAILRGLKDNLEYDSFKVVTATDGLQGYELIHQSSPDLIVLDLMLPKMDGYELCRKIRKEGIMTPVLMLTARGQEADRVLGLELGADDYVTKPFSVPELIARIRAILRRTKNNPADDLPDTLDFDDIHVDFKRFEMKKKNQIVSVAPKEFGVLRLLAARKGAVITREELLNEVWGYDNYPTTRTVDNHIAQLRNKVEEDPGNPVRVITVHGVGYKLVLD